MPSRQVFLCETALVVLELKETGLPLPVSPVLGLKARGHYTQLLHFWLLQLEMGFDGIRQCYPQTPSDSQDNTQTNKALP